MPSELGFYVVLAYLLFWLSLGICGFAIEIYKRISQLRKGS